MSFLLAIDTTLINKISITLFCLETKKTHYSVESFVNNSSEVLLKLIDNSLQIAEIKLSDIEAILLNNGPGSFTGIRNSISAALGIFFGLNINIYEINNFNHYAQHFLSQNNKVFILYFRANLKENFVVTYGPNLSTELIIIGEENLHEYIQNLIKLKSIEEDNIEIVNLNETYLTSSKLLCEYFSKRADKFQMISSKDNKDEFKLNPTYIKGVNALTLKQRGL